MENKIKHLEFIQLVITRLNVNSFIVKGWVVTLMAAVFAVSTASDNFLIPFLNYFIVPVFWIFDGYYLSQERKYRALYDEIRIKKEEEIDFNMDASKFKGGKYSWISSIFSTPFVFLYLLLIIISFGVLYLLNHG
jgi:hypothetical protein